VKTKAEQLAALIDGEPDPKRKAGKPLLPLADTFDKAMAALKPDEAQFVRHVLAGDTQEAAYGKSHPKANGNTRQKEGARIAKRVQVSHTLALGRKAGAVAAITGLAYDIKAADAQVVELIDEAREADQYSAVANLLRERLKLHKLTDQAPAAMAGASFTLVIKSADGSEQVLQPGQVIDVQPLHREEENGHDSNSN
jgi:hypothetical protein